LEEIRPTIPVREEYRHLYTDLRTLTRDGEHPNSMTPRRRNALWRSLTTLGWLYPIITNKEGVVGDGEQRLDICLEHGEVWGPVLRLDVDIVTRKIIRQVLNKLRGRHAPELDAAEYQKIITAGRDRELQELIAVSERRMLEAIQKAKDPPLTGETGTQSEEKGIYVKCPQCGFEFNPENFRAGPLSLSPSDDQLGLFIEKSQHAASGRPHTIQIDLRMGTTPTELTERTAAVAEAFGIGVDESKRLSVLTSFEFSYGEKDLIYITGDSGGGKSQLLRALGKHLSENGQTVRSFAEATAEPEEVIIEGVGGSPEEAMEALGRAGLSEAFLMVRRFDELSDGQRYRYRLAKLLSAEADVYLIDNFCDSLDRVMARVISYSVQKWARRKGAMVIVATPHHDLLEDLNPDTVVVKGFGDEAQIRYRDVSSTRFSFEEEIVIEEGTREDLEKLERFHYLSGDLVTKRIYRMRLLGETIGVAAYTSPHLRLSARSKLFPEYAAKTPETAQSVNRDIIRLSRVIVHPKFRGVGLAARLVRETLPMTGYPIVETLAAMARYNPFFEKAGMTRAGTTQFGAEQKALRRRITELGGNLSLMASPRERQEFLDSLTPIQLKQLIHCLVQVYDRMEGQGSVGRSTGRAYLRELMEGGLQTILGNLLATERVYLYWRRPKTLTETSGKEGDGHG